MQDERHLAAAAPRPRRRHDGRDETLLPGRDRQVEHDVVGRRRLLAQGLRHRTGAARHLPGELLDAARGLGIRDEDEVAPAHRPARYWLVSMPPMESSRPQAMLTG